MPNDVAKPSNPQRITPSDTAYVQDAARPVLVHGRTMAAGMVVGWHAHPRAQLLQAVKGLLRVEAEGEVWLVPTGFGVWIPGEVSHEVTIETEADTANLYIDASLSLRPSTRCEVLPVSPLLRQIIQRMRGEADPDRFARLGAVACDEITAATPAPLNLPGGSDPRLRRVTAQLSAHPEDPRPLPALASLAGASPRTLERLFHAETGLGFRQWRIRARLIQAVARLERGESSTEIALSLGYRSASAFVAAFRAHFGVPPQAYFRVL